MLPIHAVLEPLKAALARTSAVVLAAPPGAGKTTVAPLALLDQPWLGQGRILVLEPRRLAARAAADRMAATLGQQAGGTVGYRTRLQSRIGPDTRIEVVTEGVFTRMILDDPALDGGGAPGGGLDGGQGALEAAHGRAGVGGDDDGIGGLGHGVQMTPPRAARKSPRRPQA